MYQQPVVVEKFIEGREFTVGVLGNENPRVLPIIEMIFSKPRGIVLFAPDDPVKPLIQQERGPDVQFPETIHYSVCPADTGEELNTRLSRSL